MASCLPNPILNPSGLGESLKARTPPSIRRLSKGFQLLFLLQRHDKAEKQIKLPAPVQSGLAARPSELPLQGGKATCPAGAEESGGKGRNQMEIK